MTIKISLLSERGYRPMSTLIKVESWQDFQENKAKYVEYAIARIRVYRDMRPSDLAKYQYKTIRAEIYSRD